MARDEAITALRHSVAVSRMEHVRCVRVTGAGAWPALDGLVTSDLRLREGQMLHSLLLQPSGRVFADLHVACDASDFLLLVDGPDGDALDRHLRQYLAGPQVGFEDESDRRVLVTLDGPYAWELLGAHAGSDAVGLPHLTFFHLSGTLCYRAGRTGEYGYGLLVPRTQIDEVWQRLLQLGDRLDAQVADLDALDQCTMENGYFNVRREGREPVTPVELQLQWRLSNRKSFVGSDAVALVRRTGPATRLTWLTSEDPIAVGDRLVLGGAPVGRMVNAGHSPILARWVGLALVELRWAHPGLEMALERGTACGTVRTVAPPLLANRSLYVSPQIHSYATRHEYAFPSLPRE